MSILPRKIYMPKEMNYALLIVNGHLQDPPGDLNWPLFVNLCKRHRFIPHLFEHGEQIKQFFPPGVVQDLEKDYRIHTLYHLGVVREMVKLKRLLDQNEVKCLFFKGPVLSIQLYGHLNGRYYRDLDVLVQGNQLDRVLDLVKKEGCEIVKPGFELSKKQKIFMFERANQFTIRDPRSGIYIEIHWRPFNNKYLFPFEFNDLYEESIKVELPGTTVETFSNWHNFLFQCCHGASHRWFRLMWLKDVAELYREISISKDIVEDLNLSKIVNQSLALAQIFFHLNPKIDINGNDNLVKGALKGIFLEDEKLKSIGETKLSNIFYQLGLKEDIKYKIQCLKPFLPHYDDWKLVKIPDKLFFLYFPLRPLIHVYKILRGKIGNR
ncbi:MAG: nucleotidyltransferase family protein [Bacteroidota bacterium]